MARENVPFLSFNRGLISPKSLARVDLDRTRLSAEIMTNWLPKTQGAMSLRPGTKYFGSSLNDTGAEFIEFVASTDDVALVELTHQKMRLWIGSDAHSLSLLGRSKVDTSVALNDTGWSNTSTGGAAATDAIDLIPLMTAATTGGVTLSASSRISIYPAWQVGDNSLSTIWVTPMFIDSSSYERDIETAATPPTISTAQSVFGGASILFDRTGHLVVADSADWAFGTSQFTVEMRARLTFDSSIQYLCGQSANSISFWRLNVLTDGTLELRHFISSVATVSLTSAAGVITTGTWYHIALVRDSVGFKLYVDGVSVASVADTTTAWGNFSNGLTLGVADQIAVGMNGYMDEVRVSNTARWTTGFSVPGSAYTSDANTLLLAHGDSPLPAWVKIDFGAGNSEAVTSYSLRASASAAHLDNMPSAWTLQYNDVDTGDGWTTVDSRSSQTGWAVSEQRSFERLDADTGTVEAQRYWRLRFTAGDPSIDLVISEIELFDAATAAQVKLQAGKRILNATSVGALARAEKRVLVSDTGTEHALAIDIERGPVVLRVGSSQRDDDYISETALGTGYHNLAFTPSGNFWITLQHSGLTNRIVRTLTMSDSGTVEITAPWSAASLADVRYDQSADVVFVDCANVRPSRIERRGTGRSWSVVDYAPDDGPFLSTASSSAKLSVAQLYGDTTLSSDVPFFTADHVGALIRIFHQGQSGKWQLGAHGAATDPIEMTGIADTGTPNTTNERRITFAVTGTYVGRVVIERSFDGRETGFKNASIDFGAAASGDTGTFTRTIDDGDDNIKVYYRARLSTYTSGVAIITVTYGNGGVTGIGRITNYNTNTNVDIEVLSRFSDTGPSDDWQQGYWSTERGFPTAVALHGGRLTHAQGGSVFLSVSDDYDNFDDETTGDAGPIIRTLGSGPVDNIHFLVSLLRLIIGTVGAEIMLRSSSLDEPVTPTNSSAGTFSTQGSLSLRAVKMDNRAIFVQRSGQRLFMIGAGSQGSTFGDYEAQELTLLVPELLQAGVVSIAVQRQPDTRIHCVLADGRVAIFTYDPSEEVQCWTLWESDTGSSPTVEKVVTLPGTNEDAVYYHVRRTINGATKRYLEKWAKESECNGDTGFCFLMDCASTLTDTGRATLLNGIATHLVGRSVIAWGDLDTGSTPFVDLSPDVNGTQRRYSVDTGGDVDLTDYGATQGVHKASVGLTYMADWKSAKLAYAAQGGTALAQMKRTDKIAFVLYRAHNRGLKFGTDTGSLDPLPQVIDAGDVVDQDKIFETFDQIAMPFPGLWDTDSRIYLRAQAPRPCTVLAAIPTVQTNEKR